MIINRALLLSSNHFLTRPGKIVQTKKYPFPKYISVFLKILGLFLGKTDFWPKKHFSAKRKNGRFSVIPAQIRSVVIVGHISMARTVPASFVNGGPKVRVLITAKWEWPETAKKRGEPRKMTHSSENGIFFGVVQIGNL